MGWDEQDDMGWDGWDGMGQIGWMGWDGMGWDGIGCYRIGWDGTENVRTNLR